ncbi:LysR family transcriptional regulator [Treponema brennaborense]|uniref:Transcriptional regulator, LysR family n=1 Tax=Treponema brennaborense (strain DSM 12168 / CIP 105900 / DD5/3) TaxID=906968 RepID=F4LNX5_TREBD|nr:LysR family transcriptional regulator [Treponema brennaborense]AEE17952.1 transcriptional regulator, LysR family [Treponema brennaborense DSM 12168]
MIDFRLKTFLAVCRTLNYTKAAEEVHVTQPAVSQHIQYLEREFNCKLFEHRGKQLFKTPKAETLERFALQLTRNVRIMEDGMRLLPDELPLIRIGATKTIGEYELPRLLERHLESARFSVRIDNTLNLLNAIDGGALDLALIEGFFNKSLYETYPYKTESFTGFCSVRHPFAGRRVLPDALFAERLLIREPGSGSRDIFEQFLTMNNCSLEQFRSVNSINSVSVIAALVARGAGISFGYDSIVRADPALERFHVEGLAERHAYTIVRMKNCADDSARRFAERLAAESA